MKHALFGAVAAMLFASAAAAAPTTNYGWEKPTIGADDNTWGDTINDTTDAIDADLKAVENIAKGVTAASNPAAWQKVDAGSIEAGSNLLQIEITKQCSAYRLLIRGAATTADAVGLTFRFAYNNFYNSTASYSYAGSYQNTSPTSGSFGLTNQTGISLVGSQNLGDEAGYNNVFDLRVFAASQNPTVLWDGWFTDGASNSVRINGGARDLGISSPTQFGIFLGSGVYRSGGRWVLYCDNHL